MDFSHALDAEAQVVTGVGVRAGELDVLNAAMKSLSCLQKEKTE